MLPVHSSRYLPSLLLVCTLPSEAAPPVNDSYASRGVFSGGGVAGTNVEATVEANEPSPQPDLAAAGSVWWNFTPAVTGWYEITTAGSAFDTVLAGYEWPQVACLLPSFFLPHISHINCKRKVPERREKAPVPRLEIACPEKTAAARIWQPREILEARRMGSPSCETPENPPVSIVMPDTVLPLRPRTASDDIGRHRTTSSCAGRDLPRGKTALRSAHVRSPPAP